MNEIWVIPEKRKRLGSLHVKLTKKSLLKRSLSLKMVLFLKINSKNFHGSCNFDWLKFSINLFWRVMHPIEILIHLDPMDLTKYFFLYLWMSFMSSANSMVSGFIFQNATYVSIRLNLKIIMVSIFSVIFFSHVGIQIISEVSLKNQNS